MGAFLESQKALHRTVYFSRLNNSLPINNKVETTKYTWYTFLPKAILLQFIRPANLVYLISAILQSIRVISSLNPITAIAPFVFVIGISLVREGYEDHKRYKKDIEINERQTRYLSNGSFIPISWQQLHVGDLIEIKNNQLIPADVLLLQTSQQNQVCFVETANLDGETNLKAKFAVSHQKKFTNNELEHLRGKIVVDLPNSNLHEFSGFITLQNKAEKEIDIDSFLLRQTVLKNTQYAIGIIIYAGYDSKIIQNQGEVENKVSQVQRKVNIIQGVLLIILFIMSATCAIGFDQIHNVQIRRQNLTYLKSQVDNYSLQVALIFFSSFLLLTFLIPISLNVSIEVIKGFLGIFLGFDRKVYYEPIKKSCSVNNVSILQQLGNVDYILTDKTGTLTANQMVFKHLCVGGKNYTAREMQQNCNTLKNDADFHKFWIGLIICHDVVTDPQSKQYQGSSPDEVCFLNYAKKINYQFMTRTKNIIELNIFHEKVIFQLLEIIPFDSRKRMSVVVRDLKTKKIYIYTKGADSCILEKSLKCEHELSIKQSVNFFARQGFRTLLFSYREISSQVYEKLSTKKYEIKGLKTKKILGKEQIETKQNQLVEQFQSEMILLGATAIEDRLQDNVPLTIRRLEQAGIIMMMITGDKLQTAENIGYLSNLIKQDSIVNRIRSGLTNQQLDLLISNVVNQKRENSQLNISIIIEGSSITKFLQSQNANYQQMLRVVSSVIFCRSSPKQKASIVKYVKQKLKGVVLAIGDGGNDVGMIQVANVGVGILGKQGNSASAISDFSIGQFKYLDRLVLHHGRWFYYRLSYFFVFYGAKNLIMTLLLYYYMIDSAFSAASGLSQPFITIYNVIIGLVLVVYFSVFEQDINDDLYKPAFQKLPIFYKQVKQKDLFSFKRYMIWTIFGIIISLLLYLSIRFGLGSNHSIDLDGHTGSFSHHCEVLAISLSIIVIMILISDIKMYTWFSTVLIIGILTIIVTIVFFIFQNFVFIGMGTSYMILAKSTFRFWLIVFFNVGTVYAGKLLIDGISLLQKENEVDKTIRQIKEKKQKTKINIEMQGSKKTLTNEAIYVNNVNNVNNVNDFQYL